MSDNLVYIAGHITISKQLADAAAAAEQGFDDMVSGRRPIPDDIDWDLIEESYEELGR